MLERPGEDRRRGVVDDQRNAERATDRRDLRDGEGDELRIGQRFGIIGACLGVGGAAEIFRIGRIHKSHLDALVLERVGEQVPSAAVKVGRRNDVVASVGDVLQRERRRGLAARHRQRGDAAFERGDALLEHVVGRVHDAGVDVAEFPQPEQVRRVVGVLELV